MLDYARTKSALFYGGPLLFLIYQLNDEIEMSQ